MVKLQKSPSKFLSSRSRKGFYGKRERNYGDLGMERLRGKMKSEDFWNKILKDVNFVDVYV